MAATSSTQRSNDEQRKSPRHPVFSLALASAVAYWVSRVRLGHELQPHPFTIQLSIGQRWVLSIPVLPIPFIGPPGNLFTFLPWVRKREEQASTPEEDTNDPSRRQDGTRKPRRGVTFAEQPLIATVSNTSARDAVASPGTVKRQAAAAMFMLDKLWSGDSPDPSTTPRSGASTPNMTPGTTPRSFASTPASNSTRTPLAQRSPAVSGAAVNAAIQDAGVMRGNGVTTTPVNTVVTPTPKATVVTPTTTPGSAARFVVRQLGVGGGAAASPQVGGGVSTSSKENKPLYSSTSPLATS